MSRIKSIAEAERELRLEALEGLEEEGMLSSTGLVVLRKYCTLGRGIGTAQHVVRFIGQVEIERLEQLATVLDAVDPNDDAHRWVARRLRRIARSDVDYLKHMVATGRDPSKPIRGFPRRGGVVFAKSSVRVPTTADISTLVDDWERLLAKDDFDEGKRFQDSGSALVEPVTTLTAIQRDILLSDDMSRWRAARKCGNLGSAVNAGEAVRLLLGVIEQDERWFIRHRAGKSIAQILGTASQQEASEVIAEALASDNAIICHYARCALSSSEGQTTNE